MTRQFSDRVSNVGAHLTQAAGSYLHSVASGSWSACEVCALPIDPNYKLCVQCQSHRRSGLAVADQVGFLVYADEPRSQTYRMMRGYKEPRAQSTFEPIVRALLAVGLRGHLICANRLAGNDDLGWAIVPSTQGRATFVDLVRGLSNSPGAEIHVNSVGRKPARQLNPSSWAIEHTAKLPAHVVVIDDAWVSGASAQSLAVTLKQAGVETVSILSVARVLSPNWEPNKTFLRDVLATLPYDWKVCPWTLAACP